MVKYRYVAADPARLPLMWERDPVLAEEVYSQIAALIREGFSQADIARRVGCSDRTVTRYRERENLPAHSYLTEDEVREIRARYARGNSISSIAVLYGKGRTTITYVIKRKTWKHID